AACGPGAACGVSGFFFPHIGPPTTAAPLQISYRGRATLDLRDARGKQSVRGLFQKVTRTRRTGRNLPLAVDKSLFELGSRLLWDRFGGKKIAQKARGVRIEKFLDALGVWRFQNESGVMIFRDTIDNFRID